MPNNPEKYGKTQLTIYLPVEWKEKLFRFAEEEERSFNSLMSLVIKKYMQSKGIL